MSDISTSAQAILATLLDQRKSRIERGFYWENQIAFAYNSEKMEGNPLTKDQTRSIFETHTITGRAVPSDYIAETENHFRLFDFMLETLECPLDKILLLDYHRILKVGTRDDLDNLDFVVGGWKTIPNAVAGVQTTPPAEVEGEIDRLLAAYHGKREALTYRDIAGFHVFFETIHPFQDGNGRVGRMLMFRECLVHGLEPFIVLDEEKERYYRGLAHFDKQPEYFIEFCEEMAELYLREYSSLVPEHYLLPRMREFMAKKPNLEAKIEGFWGD